MKHFSREKLVEMDVVARRYGVRPSSFLEPDVSNFLFDILVASVGIDADMKAQRKANSGRKRS